MTVAALIFGAAACVALGMWLEHGVTRLQQRWQHPRGNGRR